jgi:acyl-CoA thioesterase-1
MRNVRFLVAAVALLGHWQQCAHAWDGPEPVPRPAAATRPLIGCFGDSLTAGFGLDPGQSYPARLQQILRDHHYRYEVQNEGVNGDTTQDGLARVSLALAAHPQIVVLELGANDGLRGQPVAGIEANLAKIIEAFQSAKVKVVLAGITLPPNYGPDYVKRFRAIYPALAKKYKLVLIPFILDGVAGNQNLMQRDGLHPTAEGALIVAQTVFQKLQPMLKK